MFVLRALFCGCRERGYAKLCENPYLPPGWFAGVLYEFFHSMSLFLFGITLLWLYFILSLSLSDARCIGLIVSNGRTPSIEQTERLLPQGDIRRNRNSPITPFRGSNVFRQEIGCLNLSAYLFPLLFLMIGQVGSVNFWQLPENFVTKAIATAEANGVGPATLYSAQKVPRALNVRRTYRLLDVCPWYNMGYSILQLQQNLGQVQATYVHTYTGKPGHSPLCAVLWLFGKDAFLVLVFF